MTDEMNEKLLQEYLEGGSPISKAYQAAEKSAPPPELDRAVLAEARAAARAGAAPGAGQPRWQNWLMPASLAATVALCVALVTEVVVLNPLLTNPDSPQTFSDTLEADAEAPAALPATAGRQSPAQQMLDQKPQRPTDLQEAKQERGSTLDEFARNETITTKQVSESAELVTSRENLNAPEPTVERRASEKARAVQKDDVGDSVSSSNLQPATVAVELSRPAEDADQSGSESAVALSEAAGAGPIGGTASEVPDEIAITVLPASDRAAWPAPDVWLAGIRMLLEQGDEERAEAELEKFLGIYPDYPFGELVQGTDGDWWRRATGR